MKYKILIAEDDIDISNLLKIYLESSNYDVVCVDNGEDAFNVIQKEKIDAALLDIMMPLMNGYELTRNIRKISNMPILIISAKDQDSDKVLGLNIGADDYLTKPFNPIEVIARINSSLRRFYELGGEVVNDTNIHILSVGELYLNLNELLLKKRGHIINLTPTEYRILAKLMKSPGRIYAKSQLYESINGEFSQSDDSTMMVHISNLREKIEDDPKNPRYIKTVRGIGYKFELQK